MTGNAELEEIATHFNTSEDFDSVVAYYDVLEVAKHLKGAQLLELGSSAGTVSKHLCRLAERLDIVDGSAIALERTRQALGDKSLNINYRVSMWEEFQTQTRYSDIIMIRGLEHVAEPVRLIKRLKQFLIRGGRMHIIVPNAQSLHRLVLLQQNVLTDLYQMRDRDFLVGHKRIYDNLLLRQHLKEAGLSIKHESSFFVKPVTTEQMGQLTMDPTHPLVRACYDTGKILPLLGTQLYAVGIPCQND